MSCFCSVLSAVAVVLVESLLVDSLFCIEILNEGCRAEKSLLVENVAVLLNELEKLLGGVVLILDIGNESCAAELRKNFLLEDCINLGHILDLALTDCRIAVHGKNADDEILVLDVRLGNELLEAFPVLTYALDLRISNLSAADNL